MTRKFFLFVFALLWTLHSQAQLNLLGEFVYTVPLKKYNHVNEASSQWWHEYFEYGANEIFFSDLIKRIDSGKIQVMEPVYPYKKAMITSDVNLILHRPDTADIMDPNTGELIWHVVMSDFTVDKITSLTFLEDWFLDEKTLRFEKKVKGFTVNTDRIDRQTGERIGMQALFFVPTDPGFNVNTGASSAHPDVRMAPPITFDLLLDDLTPDDTTAEANKLAAFLKAAGNSAKSHPGVLRDTLYPFTGKLPITNDPNTINRLSETRGVRFLEEWQFDINKLVFTKKVMGVLLKGVNRDLAFLPLNNHVPVEIISSSKLVVPKFSAVSYFSLPGYRYNESRLTNADSLKIRSFGIDLLCRAQKKEFALYPSEPGIWWYDPWSANCRPKGPKEADLVFTWIDTVMEMDESGLWDPQPVARTFTRDFSELAGYRFYETWTLDLENLRFEKNIKSLGFEFPVIDRYTGEIKIFRPLFMIHPGPYANSATVEKYSYLIGSNISYPVTINQNDLGNDGYAVDYEGNIIDNIDHSVRFPFIQGILNAVLSGKIQVTDPDKPGRILTREEVRSRTDVLKDSLFLKADIPMEYMLVNRIIFNEDWYYDPSTAQFHKKVNSITLSRSFPITITRNEMQVTVMEDKKIFTLPVNLPKQGGKKK